MSGSGAPGWARAYRKDLRSFLWIAGNARNVLRSAQLLFDMSIHGGTVVEVPKQQPRIRTLIQLDGDYVTFVDENLFREGRSPEELSALIAQHQQTLQAHLPTLDPAFPDHLFGCVRVLRTAWIPGSLLMFGGVTQPLIGLTLQPSLLWHVFSPGIPLALHFGAPRLLRIALRRGWLRRLRSLASRLIPTDQSPDSSRGQ